MSVCCWWLVASWAATNGYQQQLTAAAPEPEAGQQHRVGAGLVASHGRGVLVVPHSVVSEWTMVGGS